MIVLRGIRRIALVALLVVSTLPLSYGCRRVTRPELQLVWQDEFDGPLGQLPEAAKWSFDVGTDWGNAQLEYDTDRAENVSLDGVGHLAITARQEAYLGREYTSGRIQTSGKFAQAGGRFEARLRVPTGQGMWPAFWLLGADFATTGWPTCGEIDVMEYRGQQPAIVHGSLHGPGYSGGSAVTRSYTNPGGSLADDFHVYAVEWSATEIQWSLDGQPYQTVRPADLPGGAAWVFNQPFFVILNLAVGGNFVGPPNGSTAFPQHLLVDYVRVYRRGS